MKQQCPFCKELKENGTHILLKGKLAFVLMSNPRLLPGHLLVIPKRHVIEPWQLRANEQLEIFKLIKKFSQELLKTNLASGIDIRQHYRPFIPQGWIKVDHVHYHILPRHSEDKLYQESLRFELDIFTDLPEIEREEVKSQFKNLK